MSNPAVRESEGGALIEVLVVPRSKKPGVIGIHDGKLRIRVAAAPESGRANREAERLLTRIVGSKTIIRRGMNGRLKVFQVAGMDAESVSRKLGSAE